MVRTVGFIDLGTNSIHMLVVRFEKGSAGTSIYQDKEAIRLGRSLFENGTIDEETIDRARRTLKAFSSIARRLGAEEVIACATCAARETPNPSELEDVARECGIEFRIITGLEEARLTRLGVLGPCAPRRTLLLDIGGGSTEITVADGTEDLFSTSLELGALRMSYGCGVDLSRSVKHTDYDYILRCVDSELDGIVKKVGELGFETAVGSSGTLIALANACAYRRGDGDDSYFTYNELESLMTALCKLDARQRAKFAKIGSRADIIIGGGAVAEEVMFRLGIKRMDISPNGLREGMRLQYLHDHGIKIDDLRLSAVLALASRFRSDAEHGETVGRISDLLFDQYVGLGLVKPHPVMKSLMRYAGALSEVGGVAGRRNKGELTSLIIRNSGLSGFEPEEIDTIALLAFVCRGPVPGPGSKAYLQTALADGPQMSRYCMILKIADICDRTRDSSMQFVSVLASEDATTLVLKSDGDASMAVWKLRSIGDEYRKVFGRDLRVEWTRPE